jgi:hypothetical protein
VRHSQAGRQGPQPEMPDASPLRVPRTARVGCVSCTRIASSRRARPQPANLSISSCCMLVRRQTFEHCHLPVAAKDARRRAPHQPASRGNGPTPLSQQVPCPRAHPGPPRAPLTRRAARPSPCRRLRRVGPAPPSPPTGPPAPTAGRPRAQERERGTRRWRLCRRGRGGAGGRGGRRATGARGGGRRRSRACRC